MTSNRRILGSLGIPGLVFGMFVLLEVTFCFGSHDHIWQVMWPEHKIWKTHTAYIFLC